MINFLFELFGISPSVRVRRMIKKFVMPSDDKMVEHMLALPDKTWDAGIFITTRQSERFYSNEFEFWVHAFYCFVEKAPLGSLFSDMEPFVVCKRISVEQFQKAYSELIEKRKSSQETRVKIKDRSFTKPYVMLNHPNIKSGLASSEGEYVAFFHYIPKDNHEAGMS